MTAMAHGSEAGEQVVMASRFKALCLSLLDQVATTKVPILVTKYGKPVARLVPVEAASPTPTLGSVRLLAAEDDAYFSTGEAREAEGST